MPAPHIVLILFATAIWGSHFAVAKWGLAEIPPLLFTALRFGLIGLALAPFTRIAKGEAGKVLAIAVTGNAVGLGLAAWGLSMTDASTSAIIFQLEVPFSVILGVVLLKEKVGPKRIGGIMLAFAGVAVVAGEPQSATGLGLVLLTTASAAVAFSSFLRRTTTTPSTSLLAWAALFSAPQLLVLSLILETGHLEAVRSASLPAWGSLLYAAFIATLVGNNIFTWLLRRHPLSVVSPYTLLTPVMGMLVAVLLLDETLSMEKIVGGAAVVLGVAIIELRPSFAWLRRRRPA